MPNSTIVALWIDCDLVFWIYNKTFYSVFLPDFELVKDHWVFLVKLHYWH